MKTDVKLIAVLGVLLAGLVTLSSAAAQQQNQTGNQTNNTSQFIGQDAVVMYDNAGEYMAILMGDNGELLGTAGTVQSLSDLEDQNLNVCIYQDNVNQDFIDIFQPNQGFFEGELFGDPLTDDEQNRVVNTTTCYQSQAEGNEDGGIL